MDAPDVHTAETTDADVVTEESGERTGDAAVSPRRAADERKQREIGGPRGPEPTRYGDWERAGRCIDF